MRQTTAGKNRKSSSQRRGDGVAPRVNRAQLKAMEARSISTTPEAFSRPTDVEDAVVVSGAGSGAISRRRPVARPRVLTRSEEYAYIKADMRRLIITASVLFVVMIILLFVLD